MDKHKCDSCGSSGECKFWRQFFDGQMNDKSSEMLNDVSVEGGYRLCNEIYDRTGEFMGLFIDFENEVREMNHEEAQRKLSEIK